MSALALPMIFLFYVAAAICLLTDRRRRLEGVDGLDYAALADDTASPLPVGPAAPDEDPVPVDAAAPLEDPARPDTGATAAPDPARRHDKDDDIT
jgi:hypothetical protein